MTSVGERVGGRYRLEQELGEGGSGTVFRAFDEQLGIHCAVKVLHPRAGQQERLRARLRSEVEAMSRVVHPHILRVFGSGEDEGADWIAMELSEGGSIADQVRESGPLAARRAIQVVLQVLAGLGAAHRAGVVHRDVKPDNILSQPDGTVRLCDFGIALLDDQTRVTRSGFAMGSLPYMAPEQRVDAHTVGPPADLYAAAATLFFLLTASTPVDLFLASPTSPRFSGIPEGLVELIRRGTHADPGQRFADAGDMANALRGCLAMAAEAPIDAVPEVAYEAGEGLVSSRVPTADPPAERSSDLELSLHRQWQAEARARRRRTARLTRLGLGAAFTLAAVLVAVAGTWSLEGWIEEERLHRQAMREPVAGLWRGTLGLHQAELRLEGTNRGLSGELTLLLGDHEFTSSVLGAVDEGFLMLVDEGDAIRHGTYRATMVKGARLDGEYDGGEEMEPFHLVRIE